jgi:GrpB-like predicted nucleotidyltransferase (UPF0157 family)
VVCKTSSGFELCTKTCFDSNYKAYAANVDASAVLNRQQGRARTLNAAEETELARRIELLKAKYHTVTSSDIAHEAIDILLARRRAPGYSGTNAEMEALVARVGGKKWFRSIKTRIAGLAAFVTNRTVERERAQACQVETTTQHFRLMMHAFAILQITAALHSGVVVKGWVLRHHRLAVRDQLAEHPQGLAGTDKPGPIC